MRTEEKFALIVAVAVLVLNVFLFPASVSSAGVTTDVLHYLLSALTGTDFYSLFFIFVVGFVLWIAYRFIFNIASRKVFHEDFTKPIDWSKIRHMVADLFRAVAVIMLISIPFSWLLGNMDYALRFSSYDEWLWRADAFLIGAQPFIFLPRLFTHEFFVKIFWWAYTSLPFVIGGMFIVLFIKSRARLFRLALLSFSVSVLIAFPFFAAVPCQDPGNYFLGNIRQVTFLSAASVELSQYTAVPLAEEYQRTLQGYEISVERDNAVPVTCFPSMHAVWALLCCFFLGLIHRRLWVWLGLGLWLVALLGGGLYFAQHYFVDYLAAAIVATVSLMLARWLLARDFKQVAQEVSPMTWKNAIRETFLP